MKLMKVILLALGLTLFFTACDNEQKTVIKNTPSFDELKKQKSTNIYNLKTLDGKDIRFEYFNKILTSKELDKKIVLINFFATWCPPCKKEIPLFNKLTEMYPDDFKIVSVLFQDEIELSALKEFVKEYNINFDITVGDENNRLAKEFDNVQKIPESYLFTKDGVMIEKFLGEVDEESIISLIEKLKK